MLRLLTRLAVFLALIPVHAGEWTLLSPETSPPARFAAGTAFDEARGRVVIFGGTPHTDRTVYLDDTWEWDGTTWTEASVSTRPPARQAMFMAYDSDRQVVVLYGGQHGFGSGSSWGDMWEFDGAQWTQVFPANSPGPRGEGAMAYDESRQVMVLYGGHIGGNGDLNDTWEYDGADWYQVSTPASPVLANNEDMVYDRARRRIVLFGGCGTGDRAWMYDGTNWTEGPTGPPGRNDLSMAYHPQSQRAVVFGGGLNCAPTSPLRDTWAWDGTSWQEDVIGSPWPTARIGMALQHSQVNGGLIGFGGGPVGPATDETWLYVPCPGDLDCDGVVDGIDNCPEDPNPGQVDADADGFGIPCDCNDSSPSTFPGAAENCDGRDTDCDGLVDNSLSCDGECESPHRPGTETRVSTDPTYSYAPSMAWTGTEYGLTWNDVRDGNYEIYFARVDATGAKIGAELRITNADGASAQPSLTWTGEEYGLAWYDWRDGNGEIYFARLDSSGNKLGSDVRITNAIDESLVPSLVWTGSEYGLAWYDNRGGGHQIYFARLDRYGSKIGSEVQVTTEGVSPSRLSMVWTGSDYGIASQVQTGSDSDIIFIRVDPIGNPVGTELRVTGTSHYSSDPGLAWSGSEFGLAWQDNRDGNFEIYFARVDGAGRKVAPETRITNDPAISYVPWLAWTGTEYGLAWRDDRAGDAAVYVKRLNPDGTAIGAATRATEPSGAQSPKIIWNGHDYGLAWYDYREAGPFYEIFFAKLACTCVDGDGDGFDTCVGDCDDGDLSVYPGAPQICDGLDNNCSPTWPDVPPDEIDQDGDTFSFCAGDCDETRADVYPGAAQICDRINNDCSDLTWPLAPDADRDDDGDAWTECEGDCDDTLDSTYPAAPEVCDGARNDCGHLSWPEVPADEVDDDGDLYLICAGDCDDTANTTYPGAPEICDGNDNDCDILVDEDDLGEDTDGDGVHNACDNCGDAYNPSQLDVDQDGVGNSCDNCVLTPNPDQVDLDSDDRGDSCDNCPTDANYYQDDYDGDSLGDACDNCFFDWNPTQTDMDSDYEGDHCDLDDGMIYILFHQPEYVEWQEEVGYSLWNCYRGDLAVLRGSGLYTQDPAAVDLAARYCGEDVPWALDADPTPGGAVFFLTTGTSPESSLGTDSEGVERENAHPCP